MTADKGLNFVREFLLKNNDVIIHVLDAAILGDTNPIPTATRLWGSLGIPFNLESLQELHNVVEKCFKTGIGCSNFPGLNPSLPHCTALKGFLG